MIELSLFYNYRAVGDVIILVGDSSATCSHFFAYDNVVVLYDAEDKVIGINIFDAMKLIKIRVNGLVHTLNKPIKDFLISLVKNKTGLMIDILEHRYLLGKVVALKKGTYAVDIGSKTVEADSSSDLTPPCYVILARPFERTESGKMATEISATGYVIVQEAANAKDEDIGREVYSSEDTD